MSEEVLILDSSHWNRPVWSDWPEQEGVYLKVTQGTQFADSAWKNHHAGATAEDMYVGPYHYFKVDTNGAVQANYFYEEAKSHPWDMRPVIDAEKYFQINASKTTWAARLRNCLVETEELWGVRPMIYTSRYQWQTLIGSVSWASAYDLWTAHYTRYPVPLIPDDWKGKGYRMWQFIDRPLDQNRFHGDHAEFLEWMGKELPPVVGPQVLQPGDYRVL